MNDCEWKGNFTGRLGDTLYFKGWEWRGDPRSLGYKARLCNTNRESEGPPYYTGATPAAILRVPKI